MHMDWMISDVKENQWYLKENLFNVTKTHSGATDLWSHSWQRHIVQYSFLYKNCLKDEEKELKFEAHLLANTERRTHFYYDRTMQKDYLDFLCLYEILLWAVHVFRISLYLSEY